MKNFNEGDLHSNGGDYYALNRSSEVMLIAKKVYHVDQDLYILSAAIGKVLFERKPLGELFGKPKHPQNDSDNGQLTLWEKFFG